MRRTLVISIGAAVALVSAAVAMAAVFTAAGVSSTTATLTTTAATTVKTRQCTGADGKAFEITNGRYTGTADFTNPATDLDGPLTISARTTYDTAAKLGYVEGSFRVKDSDTRVSGRFVGTLDKDGNMVGLLTGSSRGNHARVLGTLSGRFSPATGFANPGAILGSGSIVSQAVIAGPVCKGSKSNAKSEHKSDKSTRPIMVTGVVTVDTANAKITVKPRKGADQTCSIPSGSSLTNGISNNDMVAMKCELVGTPGVSTLTALKKIR